MKEELKEMREILKECYRENPNKALGNIFFLIAVVIGFVFFIMRCGG